MPKYDIEKFSNDNIPNPPPGAVNPAYPERKVYWQANKHFHNPALITAIAKWLDEEYPPVGWKVHVGSYQSNQSSPPNDKSAVEYGG